MMSMRNSVVCMTDIAFVYLICLLRGGEVQCVADLTTFTITSTQTSLSVVLNVVPSPYATGIVLVFNSADERIISPIPAEGTELFKYQNLIPGTRYNILAVFRSAKGADIQEYQYDEFTDPAPAMGVSHVKLDDRTLLVKWDPAVGHVEDYLVTLILPSTGISVDQAYVGVTTNPLGHVFGGLEPTTRYNIIVATFVNKKSTDVTVTMEEPLLRHPNTMKGSLTPDIGPRNGGTNITLHYPAIPYLSQYTSFGLWYNDTQTDVDCKPGSNYRKNNVLICTTDSVSSRPFINLLDKHLDVLVQSTPYSTIFVSGASFTYRGDPEIQGIQPIDAVVTGGVTLTVTGDNLDLLNRPKMTFTFNCPRGDMLQIKTPCKVKDNTQMLCPTPDSEPELKDTSCMSVPTTMPLNCTLSLDSDGGDILPLPEDSTALRMHRCPQVKPFDHDVQSFRPKWPHYDTHIDIKGERFATIPQHLYWMVIGKGSECEILEVTESRIFCQPPQDKPDPHPDHEGIIVQLVVGDSGCVQVVGYLDYWGLFDSHLVKGLIGAGAAFIVLILVILIICRLRRSCRQGNKPHKQGIKRVSYHPDGTPDYSRSPAGGAFEPSTSRQFCCCMYDTSSTFIHDEDYNY